MKAIYKKLLLLAAVMACYHPVCAQTTPSPRSKVRFRLMSWDSVITDLNYAQGRKVVPVSMLPNGRSVFYEYEGPDPLVFFREVAGPDGKLQAEVAGSISPGDFKDRTLLIFFKSPSDPKQYLIKAFDDSDAAIPPGCYRFINISNVPLRVKCGGDTGELPAGNALTLHGNPTSGGEITGIQVDAVTGSGVKHAYSNRLPFGKTTRTLIFVFQIPATGSFELKRLPEDIAALPKPSATPVP
jgi:hypothetical protein